jgi:hypothetical protein
MSFFKPWNWFSSEERKNKLEEQKLQIEHQKLKNRELELRIQALELSTSKPMSVVKETPAPVVAIKKEKIYASLRMTDDTVIVVLKDGRTFSKEVNEEQLFFDIKNANTVEEIIFLMTSDDLIEMIEEDQGDTIVKDTEEEKAIVKENKHLLQDHPDFVVEGDEIFLVGVKLPMPKAITASFMEMVEKMSLYPDNEEYKEDYESLKMFWYWTALNPIESSRNDLINFVRRHDVNITKNGLLEMYRKVVKVKGKTSNEAEVDFISKSYLQVKKWKKSPANYDVWFEDGGQLFLKKAGLQEDGIHSKLGNLAELYSNLSNVEGNVYTDSHTRTKVIKVGHVYQEDEDKIDLNNKIECSGGLHVGNKQFCYSGFGDVGVLALVNPSKVRSVPVSDTNKMRVSEMFIASIMEKEDYDNLIDEKVVADYSDVYFNQTLDELKEMVKDKNFEGLKSKNYTTPLKEVDISEVVNVLSEKSVQVS